MACIGGVLALFSVAPLDCRYAAREQESVTPQNSHDMPKAPELANQAREDDAATTVAEEDWETPENSANSSNGSKPIEAPWRAAYRAESERMQREARARAQANLQISIRTDSTNIVPCQPMYVTIKVTNATDQARKLDELLGNTGIRVLVARRGEQPPVEDQSSAEEMIVCGQFADEQEKVVPGKASVFFDRMLTIDRVDGSTYKNPAPKRILGEPGEYKVYAAVVDPSKRFEVLRSEPLAVTVREPTESEAAYVAFFREGRQIPPHYGFSKVDEEAFGKLRGSGQPARTVAFRRTVDAETSDKLRDMLAKHPDPPVADDIRHYLMVLLIRSAQRYDERGHDLGLDREVLAAAAQQYLEIAPDRKQLRRRGIKTWRDLSIRFDLDHAQPILQILTSWKSPSPFYEDEAASQAALDEVIAKIEARYAQHARQRAAAPPSPPPLPTD